MHMMRSKGACAGIVCAISLWLTPIALAGSTLLVPLTRLDGHILWVNPAQVNTVQGAEQLSYPRGTLINVGGSTAIVNEDIIDVVRAIRNAK